MNPLFHAIAFLTRIPVPGMSNAEKGWEKSAPFYPVVGLLLGILLWATGLGLEWLLPLPIAAALLVVWWVYLTGALHLDGWMDLADGLGSNREREKALVIMKDSRVGAMGVVAAILLLMVKAAVVFQLFIQHQLAVLLVSAIAARFALTVAIWFWPYISRQGIGSGLRTGLNLYKLIAGFSFTLIVAFLVVGYLGVAAFLISMILGWMFNRYVSRKLGGLTGDVYGALVEWTEINFILIYIVLGRFFS